MSDEPATTRPGATDRPATSSGRERAVRDFPRLQARTRRFTLGAPRSFEVSEDGSRVAFLRSAGPEDPVNSLWVLDATTGETRLVLDPATLDGHGDLPAEERARRERVREVGGGIVAYSTDPGFTAAVAAVGGSVVRVDIDTGDHVELAVAAGAYDPRVAPEGGAVAYVAGEALRIHDDDGDRVLADDPDAHVSWGAAEFVAAEEMGRTRGFWWAPDARRLAVARVDVSPVSEWWISAPADPASTPTPVRFPPAGGDNADVSLHVVTVDGRRTPVNWDRTEWEYLAAVAWTDDGLVITLQTRDQRAVGVFEVDPETGEVDELHRVVDDVWVELIPGTPARCGPRLVTVEDRDGARRLCVNGEILTDDDLQVRSLVGAGDDGVVVTASPTADPTEIHVHALDWSGGQRWRTTGPGAYSAVGAGSTTVVVGRSLESDGVSVGVRSPGAPSGGWPVDSRAAGSGLAIDPVIRRTGSAGLVTAVLKPSGHDGSTPLPVLLDPYGGPHGQRVQRARALFDTSQWFAEQGFAVVVTDGRGTPGRGPEFEHAVRGDLASGVLADQVDTLLEVAAADDTIDLSRVAIRGWSFGGFLAALAVMDRPDVFHAAVAGAPVTDWRLYDTHYTERYLGRPDIEPEAYERSDLLHRAPKLERPLMLIHGLADDNVVVAHTLQLSRALLEAGRPHTVLPLSGVTHMTPQEEVAENLLRLQIEFLCRSLGVPDPAQR